MLYRNSYIESNLCGHGAFFSVPTLLQSSLYFLFVGTFVCFVCGVLGVSCSLWWCRLQLI